LRIVSKIPALQGLLGDWFKRVSPVLLQAVEQKGAVFAVFGGQPGKGFEPKNQHATRLPRLERLRDLS
jgi:hypothetical protein